MPHGNGLFLVAAIQQLVFLSSLGMEMSLNGYHLGTTDGLRGILFSPLNKRRKKLLDSSPQE